MLESKPWISCDSTVMLRLEKKHKSDPVLIVINSVSLFLLFISLHRSFLLRDLIGLEIESDQWDRKPKWV